MKTLRPVVIAVLVALAAMLPARADLPAPPLDPAISAALGRVSAQQLHTTDERLVALTRRGQHAAFETLCGRYQSRLLSFCRHMLASREDAEDVLQEVFTAAFNAILADERDINVRPWLYRIARNRVALYFRQKGIERRGQKALEDRNPAGNTPEPSTDALETPELLHAALLELSETEREALRLKFSQSFSHAEIARLLQIEQTYLGVVVFRALRKLRRRLEGKKR